NNQSIQPHRNPDLFAAAKRESALEPRRRNSTNRVRRSIEGQKRADHVRFGTKFISPEAVTDNRDIIAAEFCVLIREEKSAEGGTQSYDIEIVRAHELPLNLLRFRSVAPR